MIVPYPSGGFIEIAKQIEPGVFVFDHKDGYRPKLVRHAGAAWVEYRPTLKTKRQRDSVAAMFKMFWSGE